MYINISARIGSKGKGSIVQEDLVTAVEFIFVVQTALMPRPLSLLGTAG